MDIEQIIQHLPNLSLADKKKLHKALSLQLSQDDLKPKPIQPDRHVIELYTLISVMLGKKLGRRPPPLHVLARNNPRRYKKLVSLTKDIDSHLLGLSGNKPVSTKLRQEFYRLFPRLVISHFERAEILVSFNSVMDYPFDKFLGLLTKAFPGYAGTPLFLNMLTGVMELQK